LHWTATYTSSELYSMGSGDYSFEDRTTRSIAKGYHTKSINETFSQRNINVEMSPVDMTFRESRDSDEHPNSVAIILALDVTGSMGGIPHSLVKDGFPTIMDGIIKADVPDPQVLFLGIGDHETDNAPLQVGQFESSDLLLDKWLTNIYLEGGGGANAGESYLLAWYLAAYHTEIDCHEKRGQKGFLFTIGDEPTLTTLNSYALTRIMGEGQYEDFSAEALLEKAREKYHVYHIHTRETRSGRRESVIKSWESLMGDDLVIVQGHDEIPEIIAGIIADNANVTTQKDVPHFEQLDRIDEIIETAEKGPERVDVSYIPGEEGL